MTNETFKKLTTGCFYDRLFAFMEECKINNITVAYSGGGDSGSVDSIDVMFSKKSNMSLDEKSALNKAVEDWFEEELSQPIWNKHGSFADGGGYSVNGHVVYNAKDKTVIISGTDHYWSDSYNEETEEYEEDEGYEEGWDDLIYSKKEEIGDWEDDTEDYEFVIFYAIHVKKAQLPEEIHNRILLAATDGDSNAKRYIMSLKNLKGNKK